MPRNDCRDDQTRRDEGAKHIAVRLIQSPVLLPAYQTVCGNRAKTHDDFRFDRFEFAHQEPAARAYLARQRSSVVCWSAATDIRDVHIASSYLCLSQELVEQITGLADERFSLFHFVFARRFSHQHYFCGSVSVTRHFPQNFAVERAPLAGLQFGIKHDSVR